ncbi:HAMP domain-containing sensor histidine kinase [soil metagenome]
MADRTRPRPHRTGSVRFRVTATASVVVLLVLGVVGVGLVVAQQRLLTENLDESMQQSAANIEAALAGGSVPQVLGGFGDDDDVVQVVGRDGRVLAATLNVEGQPPIAAAPPRDARVRTVDGIPTESGRFRILSVTVEDGGAVAGIHLAASLEDIEDSRDALLVSLAVAVPPAVLLLAVVIWLLVGRTLRPVEAIRAEVAEISGSGLDRRVPAPASDDEIARLARTMNAMLDRVELAAHRQQRFVADASHELRSPLARMRAELEVDLAHPERADLAATHRSVLDEAAGLEHLVDDLLHLARSDAGVVAPRLGPVDLDDIVGASARSLRAGGGVAVDTSAVTAVQVLGERVALARAVANLADNAARHARSTVIFTVAEDGGQAVVTVTDDGPGVPPDEREHVFERFTRLDAARGGATGGTGLGLAIARDVVQRHGGTLAVDPIHEGGARFVLTLPLPRLA